MSQMIDLCGTPIQIEKIKDFRLIKRECLYYPAYQETQTQGFSLFARVGAQNKKKFAYTQMVPFGILLNDKEKPSNSSYEIKAFGEALTFNIYDDLKKVVGDAASLAVDLLRIDTSGNKKYRVLTVGRRVVEIRLREIPAKVKLLSGEVRDVYKNDSIYEFLGESISPTIVPVQTLVVATDKANFVFFGGIDMDDPEAVYHMLFDKHNEYLESRKRKVQREAIFSLPKMNLPQLPFFGHKNTSKTNEDRSIERLEAPHELSAEEEVIEKHDSYADKL